MGRPRIEDETVVISANGEGAAWNPKVGFIGGGVLAQCARTAAEWGMVVNLHPMMGPVSASGLTPLGAYAALSWAAGGRDILIQAPAQVDEFFAEAEALVGDEGDVCPDDQIEFNPLFDDEAV